MEQKGGREGGFVLCFSRNVHLLLRSSISAPGSQAFGLELGLTSLAPPGSLVFGFGLELYHPLTFLGLQLADSKLPDLASIAA